MMNVIKKLWNGDYSLGATFWLFGWARKGLCYSLGCYLGYFLGYCLGKTGVSLPVRIAMFVFFDIPCLIIWLVGVWKSANKYTGRQIWATLAKIYVVFDITREAYLVDSVI